MRDNFLKSLTKLAQNDKEIILLTGDLGFGVFEKFEKNFPGQYFNVGVAEQNMIGIATGLALEGKKVVTYSIGNFGTLRCLEQIKINICSMNLPVTIVGAGAGFSFGYDGPTHHGHQDVSSMRLLPEMSIVEISSCDAAKDAVDYAVQSRGPCYIRLDKGPFPDWPETETDFRKGYRVLRPLTDVNIVSNGFIMREAISAADVLKAQGVNVGVVDLFRFKPFPECFLDDILSLSKKVISIEESCKTGGLGTALSEVIAQNNVQCSLKVIAAPDSQFIEYGDRAWFHEKYGLAGVTLLDKLKIFSH